MEQKIKKIVKKTAKIAGVTCIAAGAIAIVTSKAALQAMLKGGEYLKDTVKKIMEEDSAEEAVVEAEGEEMPASTEESVSAEEPVVTEEDFVAEEAPAEENT